MPAEYVAYKKFTDLDSAEEILRLLKENHIVCHLLDETFASVKIVGYSPIDFGITLNIKPGDFGKANFILEQYYLKEIEKADSSYYLFDFSDDELMEIAEKPYDWGEFDYHLARKILNSRGIIVNEAFIETQKEATIADLSKIIAVSKWRIFFGYLFAFIFPPYSMISGFLIIHNRNILPDGKKVYLHSETDRRHGKIIVTLSGITAAFIILGAVFEQT
jgi:hypothetical protein